jgi:hypothetical protein
MTSHYILFPVFIFFYSDTSKTDHLPIIQPRIIRNLTILTDIRAAINFSGALFYLEFSRVLEGIKTVRIFYTFDYVFLSDLSFASQQIKKNIRYAALTKELFRCRIGVNGAFLLHYGSRCHVYFSRSSRSFKGRLISVGPRT